MDLKRCEHSKILPVDGEVYVVFHTSVNHCVSSYRFLTNHRCKCSLPVWLSCHVLRCSVTCTDSRNVCLQHELRSQMSTNWDDASKNEWAVWITLFIERAVGDVVAASTCLHSCRRQTSLVSSCSYYSTLCEIFIGAVLCSSKTFFSVYLYIFLHNWENSQCRYVDENDIFHPQFGNEPPVWLYTVFHKIGTTYLRLTRTSWSIFIILASVERGMNTPQYHVIYLLHCLMTS